MKQRYYCVNLVCLIPDSSKNTGIVLLEEFALLHELEFYSNLKTKVEVVVASLRIMTPPEFKLNLRGSDMIKKGKRMYFLLNVGKWLLSHMNLSDIDPSTVALALFECIREFTLSSLTTWVYHGVFLKVKMLNMGQTRFSTSLLAILVKQKELMTWHAS